MSSGVKGGASRVSIPTDVKKMVENIKEITGQNHSEDEIYTTLKECSMDPNETIQKLLLLDTFHEVKRKRDRRKENPSKEPAESKWKPGTQARANRVSRGNYSSRYISQEAGGGRILTAPKENASYKLTEKDTSKAPLGTSQDTSSSFARPITVVSNGPSGITSQSTNVIHENHATASEGVNQSSTTSIGSMKSDNAPGTKDVKEKQTIELSNTAASVPAPPATGSYVSSSDTLQLPSQDSKLSSAVGTILLEFGTELPPVEPFDYNLTGGQPSSVKILAASDVGNTNFEQKIPNDFQGVGKNQLLESAPTAPCTVSRPSSNYNNRSQVTGPQKAGLGKEWKPKSTNSSIDSSKVRTTNIGIHSEPQTTPLVLASVEPTSELQRKLEEIHMSDSQHVIIPNHLQVPEIEKLGFCFGSFDASFGLNMNQNGVLRSENSPLLSESFESTEAHFNELQLSNQNASVAAEDTETKYPEHPQSPSHEPEIFSSSEQVEVSSTISLDYSESKPEIVRGNHQHPVVHTSSNYSIGFMPPTLGSQIAHSETSEPQARDASRLPGFVVPQSFDPASYYAQFYRSGLDGDGRISPFQAAGPANMFNGNDASVLAHTSQAHELQAGVSSTPSQTLLVNQATGPMQSSITATQQHLPVFRQSTGVHLPHYPSNYIPYGPYFPPFYVPPTAVHQFLSNGAFPHQPAAGLYPNAPRTNAKYSVSQYNKQGSNMGSSTHFGVPGNYGPYGLSMPNYTSGSATAAITSTSNEEAAAPQPKDNNNNNVYVSGQQNEGSGVWYSTAGRDISSLHQASSFYNLPHGQLAFAPSQPGHGPFPGIFHPQSQAITNNPVDMVVGPTGGVYQQPQHIQFNWPSNY